MMPQSYLKVCLLLLFQGHGYDFRVASFDVYFYVQRHGEVKNACFSYGLFAFSGTYIISFTGNFG